MPTVGYNWRVTRWLLSCALLALFAATAVAQPVGGELLGRLLSIADPDQVQAFRQLRLSSEQLDQLRYAALEFLPRVEKVRELPGGQMMLVPEALARVDGILTPEQRPLARKLIPRAHQWPKLKALYQDYQP